MVRPNFPDRAYAMQLGKGSKVVTAKWKTLGNTDLCVTPQHISD
jgi:hypothetical protein